MTKRQRDATIEISDSEDESEKLPVKARKKAGRKPKSETSADEMGCLSSKRRRREDGYDRKLDEKPSSTLIKGEKANLNLILQDSSIYEWSSVDYIQEVNKINRTVAESLVKLFDADNTVPFIARYRKAQTGGLDADKLRTIKESYDRVSSIKQKANTVLKSIENVGKWTPELHNTVKSIKTLNELEHIHTLYKTGSKRSLAERARDLGLAPFAEAVLQGVKVRHLTTLINPDKDGLQDEEKVKNGVVCILADMINKDKRTFDKIKELREKFAVQIHTKKALAIKSIDAKTNKKKDNDDKKYEMYFDWSTSERNIKPHHVLAINRAEAEKFVTVQITISGSFETALKRSVLEIYNCAVKASPFHKMLVTDAFHQAYKKSIMPAIIRRTRKELSEKAEEASMEVFAVNVKQLLLTRPIRGKVILGMDPGFTHGCKLAVISAQGEVVETTTIYPLRRGGKSSQEAANTLATLVRKYQCSILALGNATACRETERFISDLIKSGLFGKQDVDYTIVNEAGASIYSCSAEAKSEFPTLDINVISAASIARRLQDPLAELVKVDPQHLGVGMYQHDLPEKQLMSKLNEVVMEAVSFVGVDINTASHCLLKRIAGVSDAKATNIIEWRKQNGPFTNREQLRKVKGIGVKTFEQCAGFIRILPETALSKSAQQSRANGNNGFNYLDQTWIHPESYKIANALIKACGVNLEGLGTREFISAVNVFVGQGYAVVAKQLKTNEETLETIVKGLTMAKGEDIRSNSKAPLFRNSLRCMADLTVGSLLSGEVRNPVHFGAFVDVGVERDGLIHATDLQGEILRIGQRVDVKVKTVNNGKFGLILIRSY